MSLINRDADDEDLIREEFFFDGDLQAAIAELRRGRFEECLHHLDRAFDGELSGLLYLYEQEKERLKTEGASS